MRKSSPATVYRLAKLKKWQLKLDVSCDQVCIFSTDDVVIPDHETPFQRYVRMHIKALRPYLASIGEVFDGRVL